MKTIKYLKRGLLIALFLVLSNSISSINAAIHNQFNVSIIKPDNQITSNVNYFDLKVNKDQKQYISINITNSSNVDMNAKISINNAITGNNGGAIYNTKKSKDSSLKFGLSDLLTIENDTIEVLAGQTKQVELNLSINDYSFDGIILGGIAVVAFNDEDQASSKEDLSIDNQIEYVVGVKLSMDENNIVDPNLSLLKTYAKEVDFKATVAAQIQSDQAILMSGVKVKGNIYKKNSKKIITSVSLDNVEIAPNSTFDIVYNWNNQKIKQGTYRIKMSATYKTFKWEWDEEFTVGKEAKAINEKAFLSKKSDNTILILFMFILLLLLLIIALYILKRHLSKRK